MLKLKITLRHLFVKNERQIGIQFISNKVIQALVKELPQPVWSEQHQMVYIRNTKGNIDSIFTVFKGVAWVNCQYFFKNRPLRPHNPVLNIDDIRKRVLSKGYRSCPEEYLQKLELKRYSIHTARAYVSCFEAFINHCNEELMAITELEIREYLQALVQKGLSNSYINQTINSIKFYYEVVNDMPNRFYDIERPFKEEKLPIVVDRKVIIKMINQTSYLKHNCIIGLLYSAGLRRSELINLKISDVDSNRMVIKVVQGKGNKDRFTLLGENILSLLRAYYKKCKPEIYLFEGPNGGPYSSTRIQKIVAHAAKNVGLSTKITPHTLRHSFATHLLEAGTDLRYIQALLGHKSSRTTEIYTHVALQNIKQIKNLLDSP